MHTTYAIIKLKMGEQKTAKPQAVVDGKVVEQKRKRKLHLPHLSRKTKLIVIPITLVVLVTAGFLIYKYATKNEVFDPRKIGAGGDMTIDEIIATHESTISGNKSSQATFEEYLVLAQLNLEKGDINKTLEILAKASALEPDSKNPLLYFFYGQAYEKNSDKAKAVEAYNKTVSLCNEAKLNNSTCVSAKQALEGLN